MYQLHPEGEHMSGPGQQEARKAEEEDHTSYHHVSQPELLRALRIQLPPGGNVEVSLEVESAGVKITVHQFMK